MGDGITEAERKELVSKCNENPAFRPPYNWRGIYDAIAEFMDKTLIKHSDELADPKYWRDGNE